MQRLYIVCIAFMMAVIFSSVTIAQENQNISDPFSQAKFVPDISLIMDTSYVHNSDKNFAVYEHPGFIHHHQESEGEHHEHGFNQHNGFNFNYAEISFYAPVDPYFDMFAVVHAGTDGAEIEEAYFTTLASPFGFKIKAGKFLSSIGRINDRHAHYLDFADLPLVYQAFFGSQLNEIGAQINYVLPLPFYLLAGAEILKGENEASFGVDGFTIDHFSIDDARYPNVYTSFVKASFDAGNLTLLVGASGIYGKSRINHIENNEGHAFYGSTSIAGADITLRYDFSSYQYIALQSEFLYRHKHGDFYQGDGSTITKSDFTAKQSGLYSQLIVRTGKLTRIGLRYDLLAQNNVNVESGLPTNMPRYSAMFEYNPTEFSRFRLQYTYDKSLYDENENNNVNHQIVFQCNL
ncbi:MAG: hypothetical protein ACUVRK_05525, partial [Spirochaetota bacterium]